jgi:MYXO-CTERM domain-containing protein
MPRCAFLLAVGCVLVVPARGRGDAIGPPPSDCPAGTVAVASHCSVCAPDLCTGDTDCEPGERCEERSYCTRVYDTCGGWGGPGATDARPVCGAATTCPASTTCEALRVCVPGAAPMDAAASDAGREHARYGCACRAGYGGAAGGAVLAALAAAALLGATRRRRRRG